MISPTTDKENKMKPGTSEKFYQNGPVPFEFVDYNVIVIGAGISGLTAAYLLTYKDPSLSLIVLEARDSIGGKAMTIPLKVNEHETDLFDLGTVQWVCPSQTYIMELLNKLKIETYPQYNTGHTIGQAESMDIQMFKNEFLVFGSLLAQIELNRFIKKIECLSRGVWLMDPFMSHLSKKYDGMTVEALLRDDLCSETARDIVRSYARNTFGVESSQISALFFIAYATAADGFINEFKTCGYGNKRLRIEGGATSIVTKLCKEIGENHILTSSPVTNIEQYPGGVNVITATGHKYSCHHVIVAVSPTEIRNITFQPSLSVIHSYILQSFIPGHCTSFVATYSKPFWRQHDLTGEIFSDGSSLKKNNGPICAVYDATTSSNNAAVVGFINGINNIHWSNKNPDVRKEVILHSLSNLFNDTEALVPIDYKEINWSSEAYIGGSPMCAALPGIMRWLYNIRSPYGRIHWAGSETAVMWYGHMGGAVEAGRRAAIEVLYELRPQVLTIEDVASVMKQPERCYHHPHVPHVYRWTIILPLILIGLGSLAYGLRSKYGFIGTGRIA